MVPIAPSHIRYIKLGPSGRWAHSCLADGIVPLGHHAAGHDVCAAGEWDRIIQMHRDAGRSPAKATDLTREVRDFYELGSDCLWITFADRQLWWTFADREVRWIGKEDTDQPSRHRRAIGGWCNTDRDAAPMLTDGLSTWLTQVANYRQTICAVKAADYLVRRINCEPDPLVDEARVARQKVVASARNLIAQLHWADFEIMVDLIFARGGWQRVSEVGGTMADVDLVLEQPTLNERASVQVKSTADQSVLEEHLAFFRQSGHARTFFVCHSPRGDLRAPDAGGVHVWTGDRLAQQAVQAGLFDWLVARAA